MNKVLFALIISFFLFCSFTKEKGQPNIVVILCDDLGYGDLGCFGHSVIKTPQLDAMAEKGMKFSRFYSAAPVCSPSRAGLLTGRNPNKAGIYDFIPGPKLSEDCRDIVHLQSFEQTIPAMLKKVGYQTCLSGKWHCSSQFNKDVQPKPDHFGFDHWFSTHNNASPSHQNPKNFIRNGEAVGEMKGFSCQLVVDEALSWIDKCDEDAPFYLQVCFHEPHVPIASPDSLVKNYLPYAKNENQAQFFANVANMDAAVGRLVDYLEKNHKENTLVVFSSDNGPETLLRYSRAKRSYGTPGPLKGMKLWTTEGGIRVPGILYWIGRDTFHGETDCIVSSLDFMPTFAKIAGAELPDRILDGESMMKIIDKGDKKRKKPLLWCFYDALNERVLAMNTDRWKIMAALKTEDGSLPKLHNMYDGNEQFIKNAELYNFKLYDMETDKEEVEDVASKYPKVFQKLKKQLEQEYSALLDESFVWKRN